MERKLSKKTGKWIKFKTSVTMDPDLLDRLQVVADREDRSISWVIEQMVIRALDETQGPGT